MKSNYQLLTLVLGLLLLYGCNKKSEYQSAARTSEDVLKNYILDNLNNLEINISKMKTTNKIEAKTYFIKAKEDLKKIEAFLTYITPKKMVGVNGPPLPVFREDNGKVLPPIGFQTLEEMVYSKGGLNETEYLEKLDILSGFIEAIKQIITGAKLSERHLFIPVHQQLFSIFSLGLISFDTPVSQRGLEESIVSLQSIENVYHLTLKDTINKLKPELNKRFLKNLNNAKNYLENNSNFETFDRYTFTRNHINRLTKDWKDIRLTSGLFEAPSRLALNLDADTFFESNSFNTSTFLKTRKTPSEEMVSLGKKLFFDKKLSAKGNMACATCHKPDLAYQDGLKTAIGNNGNPLKRNTPTIINSVFQRKFFWDGRSDDLVQQINLVFENEDEFDRSSAHEFSLITLDSAKYADLVFKAFPNTKKLTKKTVSRAIASYVATLNAFNSKFDKNMRGESSDFTEQEILGMNIFMGKGLCATCHFLPLTSGTVPPNLRETEKEIIGTPKTGKNKEVDDDKGFYWVYEADIHKYMFKTPSIRNIELTAPYMHNGVYNSLEEVMNFYNKGGGGGMGFDLEHQTLPFDNLNLNETEIDAVIAFMKTFTDTSIN